MRRLSHRLAPGLAILMAGLLALTARAQPASPVPPEEIPVGLLAEVQIDQLPSPVAEVWLVRFTLEPGGVLPADVQIGPTIAVIEQGVLTLESDQPVEVTGSGAEPVITGDPATFLTSVEAGQTVFIHEDTRLEARNESDVPATMLAFLMFSPERENEAMAEADQTGTQPDEPRGVTTQLLGATGAELPAEPGLITIERVSVEPGGILPADLAGGATVGAIQHGDAVLTVSDGNCYVWPALATPGGGEEVEPDRHELGPGQSAELPAGDGFGCANGSFTWQAGEAGATIIRAVVTPLDAATPAAVPS